MARTRPIAGIANGEIFADDFARTALGPEWIQNLGAGSATITNDTNGSRVILATSTINDVVEIRTRDTFVPPLVLTLAAYSKPSIIGFADRLVAGFVDDDGLEYADQLLYLLSTNVTPGLRTATGGYAVEALYSTGAVITQNGDRVFMVWMPSMIEVSVFNAGNTFDQSAFQGSAITHLPANREFHFRLRIESSSTAGSRSFAVERITIQSLFGSPIFAPSIAALPYAVNFP